MSYDYPHWILSESQNSRIFEGLYSHWEIRKLDEDVCEIVYNIQMTFANPLYSSVTTHFFDYLANNINKAFEKRCEELYYKDRALGVKKGKDESAPAHGSEKRQHAIIAPKASPVLDKG